MRRRELPGSVTVGNMADSIEMHKVVDVDWKFGVTASTSEEDKVGTSYLHLKITVASSGKQHKNIYLEMTLPQFYSFLHELEKAKASLDFLA
ncbi:COMM domain-containing protein 7 [Frankliniella fusca]|uniref:COMM domain-containing protein 7 n=1 Tax=Frankliniella fusca TaxID=407009 RepID=A0AAE1LAA9_9NEOP|nr:COMM domain-containing protein 7 [Frankliniella fusca]